MKYLDKAVEESLISISPDEKNITYLKIGKTYKYSDPEEKVRANFYCELIYKYQYDFKYIDLEVVVPRRTPNDLADIVIYKDSEKKDPFITIECKKENISAAEFDQAIEQTFGNANSLKSSYAGLVSGASRRFFDTNKFPSMERQKNIISDIPVNYGKLQEFRFKKGDKNWDLQIIKKEELIRALERCNDTLWDGGKNAPIDAFDELCKLLFIKMADERSPKKKGEPYDFQIKTNEASEDLFKRINKLYSKAQEIDPDVFTSSINITASQALNVVNYLQHINLTSTDLDTKGIAFENFMEDFFKGKQGQYFTPREIVEFMIEISGIDQNSKVIDPACGSSGFLLHSLEYIRQMADEYYEQETREHFSFWHEFASKKLFGIEVNERIARVSKMNMIIHDDGHTNIICEDALERMKKIKTINTNFKENSFDFVLTNPPFGASVKKDEKDYLSEFDLGKNKNGKIRESQKTEILFIERCAKLLKKGTGKALIILPDGILTNKTQKYVRDFLLDQFEIEAIFSIPQVTFAHYGAGLKSSILILRRKEDSEEDKDYDVYCSIINNVGYDRTGREDISDLQHVIEKFKTYKETKETIYEDDNYVKKISQLNNDRLDSYYYSPKFEKIISSLSKLKYPLVSLGECCEDDIGNLTIFNGKTPAKKEYSENPNNPKIVKVASLDKNIVNLDKVEFVDEDLAGMKSIDHEDILVLSSAHSAEYLGKNPSIVEKNSTYKDEEFYFVGELINIRTNKEILNPYYLIQLLQSNDMFLLLNREKRGQTSHLYPSDLKNLLIPLPEIDVQNKNAESYILNFKKYKSLVDEAEKVYEKSINDFSKTFLQ